MLHEISGECNKVSEAFQGNLGDFEGVSGSFQRMSGALLEVSGNSKRVPCDFRSF